MLSGDPDQELSRIRALFLVGAIGKWAFQLHSFTVYTGVLIFEAIATWGLELPAPIL